MAGTKKRNATDLVLVHDVLIYRNHLFGILSA